MSHCVCDGVGLKGYAYLLSAIYRNLQRNQEYIPEPNHRGNRSTSQVWKGLNLIEKAGTIFYKPKRKNIRGVDWSFPWCQTRAVQHSYIISRSLPPARFEAIKNGSEYQATINDVILAAFYRAFYFSSESKGMDKPILIPIDLRRYIKEKKANALCNLASVYRIDIGKDVDPELKATLIKVLDNTEEMKKGCLILHGIPKFAFRFKICSYKKRMRSYLNEKIIFFPILTNIGKLDPEKLSYPDAKILDAYITASVFYHPTFSMAVSSYEKRLTFSIGFKGSESDKEIAEKFLDNFERELPS